MKQTVEWLENGKDHSFYLIGDTDRRNYYPAIIGMARDKSHVVYPREKLIDCFMKADNCSYEEAEEWIDFNVERSLPLLWRRSTKNKQCSCYLSTK